MLPWIFTNLAAGNEAASKLDDNFNACLRWAVAGGTADALTATYTPANTTLDDGLVLGVRATVANATATPTFAPDGLTAHTITKLGGSALVAGDINGNLTEILLRYNLANTRWELLNPKYGNVPWAVAGGTSDAITATYVPPNATLTDGLLLSFRANGQNATTTPTFSPDGLTAHTITKNGGAALAVADIAGTLGEYFVRYNLANTRWELMNPVVSTSSGGTGLDGARGLKAPSTNIGQGTWTDSTTTYGAVASGTYNLFDTTNNDGFIISDPAQYSAFGVMILTPSAAGVFEYTYWNGASWFALTIGTVPTWTAAGITQGRFTVPGDWAVGGSGTGVPAGNYNIRVRATTHPTNAVVGRCFLVNKVDLTADEVILSNVSAVKIRFAAVSVAPDIRVAGSAANGRDQAGAFGATSDVFLWGISNGATFAGLWSASSTAPTLPTGYTYKILLGGYRIDANSLLVAGEQFGNEFTQMQGTLDVSASTATILTAVTPTIPANAIKWKFIPATTSATTTGIAINDRPFAFTGTFATADVQYVSNTPSSVMVGIAASITLSISKTAYYVLVAAQATNIRTIGWVNPGNIA